MLFSAISWEKADNRYFTCLKTSILGRKRISTLFHPNSA